MIPDTSTQGAAGVVDDVVERACVYTEAGICSVHGQGVEKWKPKKTWAKGRNGLFKWKYGRHYYWSCTEQKSEAGRQPAHKPTFLMLSDSADMKKDLSVNNGGSWAAKPNRRRGATAMCKQRGG